jgi:hypothetical protein
MNVVQAITEVMRDVGHVAKSDRNENQRFMFRGIDSVMNAVGPALREHGVVVVPHVETVSYEVVQTTTGKPSTRCAVVVSYIFHGPDGDHITTKVAGEAWDSGDKSTPKAMSVAYRTALLQALTLPTDEKEPDAVVYERDHYVAPPPRDWRGEADAVRDADDARVLWGAAKASGADQSTLDYITARGRQFVDTDSGGGDESHPANTANGKRTPSGSDAREMESPPPPNERPYDGKPPDYRRSTPDGSITKKQVGMVNGRLKAAGYITDEERYAKLTELTGRDIGSSEDLSKTEASDGIEALQAEINLKEAGAA